MLRETLLIGSIFGLLSACQAKPTVTPASAVTESASDLDSRNYKREVWQLTWVTDSLWNDYNHLVPDSSVRPIIDRPEVRASVVEQYKLITWSKDGDIRKFAFWSDCNMPKLETRRRIIKPARTIEKEDGSGFETIPAVLKPYLEIIRTQEGCSLFPPAENVHQGYIDRSFYPLIRTAERLRDDDKLTYVDSAGRTVAKFHLK